MSTFHTLKRQAKRFKSILTNPNRVALEDFRPKAQLVTKITTITKPKFPVIDAHIHLQGPFGGSWNQQPVENLLRSMNAAQVKAVVDLDGGWGEAILDQHLKHFKEKAPERFVHFGGVDWAKWPEHGDKFGEWAAQRFRDQVKRGAEGLKIWKPFGLHVKDQHGKLVKVDDERLIPLWEAAGELKVPVLVHVADPVAFFDPINNFNERIEEVGNHPDWHFPSPPFPSFISILEAFANIIRRHKNTVFIGAHVGCYAENLGWVSHLLDECPNFYVDISARLGELGRQPYAARKFFIKYADRVFFGTDADAQLRTYQLYAKFLETDDEYFNYNTSEIPQQGRWYIYGVFLPDDVLQKIYFQNANAIVFKNRLS
jgi:predicted TIM-barrel fold metal-dependent hydrolase